MERIVSKPLPVDNNEPAPNTTAPIPEQRQPNCGKCKECKCQLPPSGILLNKNKKKE
ncbi:MAG: hypothetical protein QM610_06920 [Chitinophagaceae bacterium]